MSCFLKHNLRFGLVWAGWAVDEFFALFKLAASKNGDYWSSFFFNYFEYNRMLRKPQKKWALQQPEEKTKK